MIFFPVSKSCNVEDREKLIHCTLVFSRKTNYRHAELKMQHMSLSTRENAVQTRETMLLSREAAVAERELRVAERENRLLAKEKWAAELLEREKLIHDRERIVHEREQRLQRLTRDHDDKMDIEMYRDKQGTRSTIRRLIAEFEIPQSPPRRPLQENKFVSSHSLSNSASGNRPEMQRYQTAPAACASYPPPQHYIYSNGEISENATVNIPPVPTVPKSPSRLQLTGQNFLSPSHRRRTTLGSPSRQANPALSPMKSQTNLRAAAEAPPPLPLPVQRKHTSVMITRGDKNGGMIKLAARNTFRGRENEIVDWDKECEIVEGEMPSPFIRRRGVSRISAGLSRS
jgi:hypothetical protein